MTVSDNVGWAWIVCAISSAVSPASVASTPSAINSPAFIPTIPTPSIRSVSFSTISFVNPSVLPSVRALPLAAHGYLSTFIFNSFFLASFSVKPHHATSGLVKTTAGIIASFFAILLFIVKILLKNAYFMSYIYRIFD